MKRIPLFILALYFPFCTGLFAQFELELAPWATGFNNPVDIENAGDGRLFIVEKTGYIRIIEANGNVLAADFLDIDSRTSSNGERGLLGLAFHPDYATNGYFYVNYTNNSFNTRISRFERDATDPNLADASSEVILLTIDQPVSNHNAGDLGFGPNDGYLYIPLGDGGGGGDPGNRSQNTSCLLGKMLRIDVDNLAANLSPSTSQTGGSCDFTSSANYKIPADNPFVNDGGILNEIWSIGLRNPWRFSFDSANGDMWIADVGQGQREEVDFEASGAGGNNYGWRCYEGTNAYNLSGCGSGYVDPIYEYTHSVGRSITGGYVYRGSLYPNMNGYYFMADYAEDKFFTLLKTGSTVEDSIYTLPSSISSISTFGVDSNNELYFAGLGNGTIYRVEDALQALPVDLTSFTGISEKKVNHLYWQTNSEEDFDYFDLERSTDAVRFQSLGQVNAQGNVESGFNGYRFEDTHPMSGINYYRLKMVDLDGTFAFSKIIEINSKSNAQLTIFPNPNDGKFSINANLSIGANAMVKIYNTAGELILSDSFEGATGIERNYDLSRYAKGIYILSIEAGDYMETIKMVYR